MSKENRKDKQRPLDFMSGKSRKGSKFDGPANQAEYTRPKDRITPFEPEKHN